MNQKKSKNPKKQSNFKLNNVKLKQATSAFGLASQPYRVELDSRHDELVKIEIPLDSTLCADREVNPSTIRLFQWDSGAEKFRMIEGSRVDDHWTNVRARIHESGIYVAAGASSSPWVQHAVSILRSFGSLLYNRKTEPIIREKICQLILCPPMFGGVFEEIGDPSQHGLPSSPPRNICDICLNGNLGNAIDLYPDFDRPFPVPFNPFIPEIPDPIIPPVDNPCVLCDLEGFLQANPGIKKKIIWRDPAPRNYKDWTDDEKLDLAKAFNTIRTGGEVGLPETAPATAPNEENLKTHIQSTDAWKAYIAHLAHTLVVETCGWVDWSITGYSEAELGLLLDSDSLFMALNDETYAFQVAMHGRSSYGDPTRVYRWLRKEGIVASDHLSTVGRLLEWCRDHLSHYLGGVSPDNMENHWQYRGFPPVERIISGTEASFGFRHWTAGCWGTSGFLPLVLRTINLPATFVINCGHAQPYFPSLDLYLSHGDDPYNQNTKEAQAAGTEMLIDQDTFVSWFDESNPNRCDNIGRHAREFAEVDS